MRREAPPTPRFTAPLVAPRGRIGTRQYGRRVPTDTLPVVRVPPLPEISDKCMRGRHTRCHGTVYTWPTDTDGNPTGRHTLARCECPGDTDEYDQPILDANGQPVPCPHGTRKRYRPRSQRLPTS